jgi:hypothetical protein
MDNQQNEEFITVLYNNTYGGFCLSDKAVNIYNERMKKIKDNFEFISYETGPAPTFIRHDPILVEIYNELGCDFNDYLTNIISTTIPKKYENYYYINEYDGLENVDIDIKQYKLDKIKLAVTNNSVSNDEKINQINKILYE